mmetsp:Transcript_77831/g.225870  ORF Transcript_77831/g.225870 Transcript_77831/m.225870 type:complete len:248 (-) Transcript_77831:26-769(-)
MRHASRQPQCGTAPPPMVVAPVTGNPGELHRGTRYLCPAMSVGSVGSSSGLPSSPSRLVVDERPVEGRLPPERSMPPRRLPGFASVPTAATSAGVVAHGAAGLRPLPLLRLQLRPPPSRVERSSALSPWPHSSVRRGTGRQRRCNTSVVDVCGEWSLCASSSGSRAVSASAGDDDDDAASPLSWRPGAGSPMAAPQRGAGNPSASSLENSGRAPSFGAPAARVQWLPSGVLECCIFSPASATRTPPT